MKYLRFLLPVLLIVFVVGILASTLRGLPGTPTSVELNTNTWREAGPLELSPERGRYALLYSVVEDKSLTFSTDIARFATPDLAVTESGQYASLFAPLVSFSMIPGYIIGKNFGAAQIGAFSAIAVFGLLNLLLIRSIAMKLGAKELPATIASLTYLFASPAFSYSVTLYQHQMSTFLILSVLYIVLRWKNWLSLFFIWLLAAASIPVDYPNLILMLPLAIFATTRMLWVEKQDAGIKVNIKPLAFFTLISALIPLLFYMWFSQASYGKPLQLSGTLTAARIIDQDGRAFSSPAMQQKNIDIEMEKKSPTEQKTATGFFHPRRIINGLYVQFLGLDRGIIVYTPVMLFGIFGAVYLWKRNSTAATLIISVIAMNVLLYSMWGDPWGGYAFGARYLIPSYALLSICIAFILTRFNKNLLILIPFVLIAGYSVCVNSLGALTSNMNPPQVEVLDLEKQTGQIQKYTFERNIDFLNKQGSKSFVYQTLAGYYLTAVQYYWVITGTILSVLVGLTAALFIKKYEKNRI